MNSFKITGGKKLSGKVKSIGNKNAVLKMIPASLLTDKPVILKNVPQISDVEVMLDILKDLGTTVTYIDETTIQLETRKLQTTTIDPKKAQMLRASNMFLGPILARKGHVQGINPGGDKIGTREMNAHFDGFKQLGAKLEIIDNQTYELSGKLSGTEVFLYEPSVTATENLILAAVTATGQTTIINAASEPHVQELCEMLNKMGAQISGLGTNKIEINGVESLHGTEYTVPPDHIYIGTFIILAAITGGEIEIENVNHEDLRPILYLFKKLGVKTEKNGNSIIVRANQNLEAVDHEWARTKGVSCQPWPCFPTDMMSPTIVLATQVQSSTLFFEKMYAGRMFFANYLNGMGANIILADPHRVIVNGKTQLHGTTLTSPDLRAGMAYVAAALCATGESIIKAIEHIDRGYPHLEEIIRELGGDIERVE